MSNVPSHLKYTKEHEWLELITPQRFKFGITDYAQGALGDIVYVQLPKVGDQIVAGKVCGEVESTKSVSEIYAPVSGVVISVNSALDSSPESINADPYGEGWLVEIDSSEDSDGSSLLTADQYRSLTA